MLRHRSEKRVQTITGTLQRDAKSTIRRAYSAFITSI